MLSDKELTFLEYWESNRTHQSRFMTKILSGLPMAILFGLPVILLVMVVYIFFPVWYAKIPGMTPGIFIMIIISVFILVIFYAYFRMHFKWEMNEQLYLELKHKQSISI